MYYDWKTVQILHEERLQEFAKGYEYPYEIWMMRARKLFTRLRLWVVPQIEKAKRGEKSKKYTENTTYTPCTEEC